MQRKIDVAIDFVAIDRISCSDTKTRRKQLLPILMELMLIDACLLVYVMPLLLSKDARLLFFMDFVRKLWKCSWTISLSVGLLLIIAYTILIKFCRDVKKQTLF